MSGQYVDIQELTSPQGRAMLFFYIFWPLFAMLLFRIYEMYQDYRNLKRNAQQ